jgi:hypothetical protein
MGLQTTGETMAVWNDPDSSITVMGMGLAPG